MGRFDTVPDSAMAHDVNPLMYRKLVKSNTKNLIVEYKDKNQQFPVKIS